MSSETTNTRLTPSLSADNLPSPTSGGIDMSTVMRGSTPPIKRKIDDESMGTLTRLTSGEGKENQSSSDKRPRIDMSTIPSSPIPQPLSAPPSQSASSGLVEPVKGKLVLKQAAHAFEIPRRKKLALEAFLLDVQEGKEKLDEGLPEEFHTVLVLAGQESPSLTQGHLINHIKKVLDMKELTDIIPSTTWSNLITELFRQKQYGLVPSDLPPSLQTNIKRIPGPFQIRAWEAKKPSKHFTEEQLLIVRTRMAERAQGREEVVRMFKAMEEKEIEELLKPTTVKGETKEKKAKESPAPSMERKSREGTGASGRSGRSVSPVKKSKMTPEEEEAARLKQEERDAKKQLKEEKRVEKEAKEAAKLAEVQKKEAIVNKQKQTMSSFFSVKPKAAVKPFAATKSSEAGPSKPAKSQISDFDRVFKPITFRPNVEWAPVNRFRYKRRSLTPEETQKASEDWLVREHVNHLVRKSGVKLSAGARLPKGLKTAPLYGSVGDIWLEHQDASDPRKVLNRLKNQRKFPWKTLAFDGQTRPPYSGTFTKKSIVVGPRTPFAQDPMFDYSYDSGDDWEDDAGGEDVDDNANLEPEEQDEDDGEDEGEFDDWLDDSEDVVDGSADGTPVRPTPIDVDGDEPVLVAPVKVVKKKEEQPKRIVKLIPTWRGPLWEKEIGEGSEGLESYRIQLLNDTPFSINPFTYTSEEPIPKYKPTYTTIAIGLHNSVRTLLSVETTQPTVQSITTPLTPPSAISSTTSAPVATVPVVIARKPRPSGPKVEFPATHLLELLRLIDGDKSLQIDLIAKLKTHFQGVTTKSAIESKLKEVAVREGRKVDSTWRVLAEAWNAAGTTSSIAPSKENESEGMCIDT